MNALAHLRQLTGQVEASATILAADLLNTIRSARDVLAPVADDPSEAGIAAGVAFQLLADADASATPPEPTPQTARPTSIGRSGNALLLADALARGRGQNLDGSERRVPRYSAPSA